MNSCGTGSTFAARSALCLVAVALLAATVNVLALLALARWGFDVLLDDVRGITHSFCCIHVVNFSRAHRFRDATLSRGPPSAVCL